ncbi:MAG: phenylalanine--tRNA ligase subunit beta [Leptospiraceae bacterium]|nr:phenylalanine--tRNA ligase subunit beta [Leptospiraceae bacterium]
MKLSFDWLCDYSDFGSVSFEKIVEKISLSICEIDDIEDPAKELNNVKVVQVLELKPHPNADKLKITTAFDGKEKYQVVTGATNIQANDIVPMAFPGAVLGGKEIKESELRGIPSFGMYCSDKELGLSEEASGVKILKDNSAIGKSIAEYLNLEDKIFVIDNKSITHRPDLWSHFGFARELAAQLDLVIKFDPFSSEFKFTFSEDCKVKQNEKAHSYFANIIKNIKVKDSVDKIKSRLEKCGVRSINNVVDVSNYVMLEMGQPTHFFDKEKLGEVDLKVDYGKENLQISLLDESTKKVNEDVLLIYNQSNPVAIAGVMGGMDSSVQDGTTNLVMESAVFTRESVRKSIKATGIRSDAAIRYEKGLNHLTPKFVISRAMNLLKENGCENLEASEPIGFTNSENKKVEIKTNFEFLNKKLGRTFPKEKIEKILTKLGFKVIINGDNISLIVPPYRHNYDVTIPEDIVEEVGRSLGYAAIGIQPLKMEVLPAVLNDRRQIERSIKKILSGNYNYNEVFNYSFASEEDVNFENEGNLALGIQNSMPVEHRFLRTSVYPSILKSILLNFDRFEKIKIYELARTYFKKENSLGTEKRFISIANTINRKGESLAELEEELLNTRNEFLSIFRLVNIETVKMEKISKDYLHPGSSIGFFTEGKEIGELGYLHPLYQENYDLKKRVIIGRLDMDFLQELYTKNKRRFEFQIPSQFPQDNLDISLILDENEGTEKYSDIVLGAKIEEIQDIWISSVYKGENLTEGKKSVTYRVSLLNFKETFTQAKINSISEALVKLAKDNGFTQR